MLYKKNYEHSSLIGDIFTGDKKILTVLLNFILLVIAVVETSVGFNLFRYYGGYCKYYNQQDIDV
jgi:hypothetical protein